MLIYLYFEAGLKQIIITLKANAMIFFQTCADQITTPFHLPVGVQIIKVFLKHKAYEAICNAASLKTSSYSSAPKKHLDDVSNTFFCHIFFFDLLAKRKMKEKKKQMCNNRKAIVSLSENETEKVTPQRTV